VRQLRYTPAAVENLADIAAYIADASGHRQIAEAFTARLRQQCSHLATLPGQLGRSRPEIRHDVRSFAIKGYVILFRYRADTVEILNVIEGHRDIVAHFDAPD
jgi:plasmid stabilization system protein ParE